MRSTNERQRTKVFNPICSNLQKSKGLQNQTGADLERYLNQEEVVAPQTVRLRLRESGDAVEIIPDVVGVDSEKF